MADPRHALRSQAAVQVRQVAFALVAVSAATSRERSLSAAMEMAKAAQSLARAVARDEGFRLTAAEAVEVFWDASKQIEKDTHDYEPFDG